MRILLTFWILAGLAGMPSLWACQQADEGESLGDYARQVRKERGKASKPAKVYTNEDIPAASRIGEPSQAPEAAPEKSAKGEKEQTAKPAGEPASPEAAQEKRVEEPAAPEGKTKDRSYWQAKFKTARERLARAKEEQQLSEDELNLLQIQQARELDADSKKELDTKIRDKQSEVETKKAATDEAQKGLDGLEQEFKESGAPEDWSVTD